MWLFDIFKPKSKRYVHVFLEHPASPTIDLARDLAKKSNIDYDGVPEYRRFLYSVDSWPKDLQEYARGIIKDQRRYPKGNVAMLVTDGALEFRDGRKLAWAIVQVIGPLKISTTTTSGGSSAGR